MRRKPKMAAQGSSAVTSRIGYVSIRELLNFFRPQVSNLKRDSNSGSTNFALLVWEAKTV